MAPADAVVLGAPVLRPAAGAPVLMGPADAVVLGAPVLRRAAGRAC